MVCLAGKICFSGIYYEGKSVSCMCTQINFQIFEGNFTKFYTGEMMQVVAGADRLTSWGDDVVGCILIFIMNILYSSDVHLYWQVKCVLVGFDSHLSYMKIMKAATYLQNPDCLFLATNEDTHLPVNNCPIRIPGKSHNFRETMAFMCMCLHMLAMHVFQISCYQQ